MNNAAVQAVAFLRFRIVLLREGNDLIAVVSDNESECGRTLSWGRIAVET